MHDRRPSLKAAVPPVRDESWHVAFCKYSTGTAILTGKTFALPMRFSYFKKVSVTNTVCAALCCQSATRCHHTGRSVSHLVPDGYRAGQQPPERIGGIYRKHSFLSSGMVCQRNSSQSPKRLKNSPYPPAPFSATASRGA